MSSLSRIAPPDSLLDGLKARYGEPKRHYHTWAHIEALLRHFEAGSVTLHRPKPVLWALYWHDAVYDPTRGDNEAVSATLLVEEAREDLSTEDLSFATAIIRATHKHQLIEGLSGEDREDMAFFLDIDLSILAAREDVFDTYEKNIRKEYAFVPEARYREARAGILKTFLERERLYFTPTYLHAWENRARANLRRSIEALS